MSEANSDFSDISLSGSETSADLSDIKEDNVFLTSSSDSSRDSSEGELTENARKRNHCDIAGLKKIILNHLRPTDRSTVSKKKEPSNTIDAVEIVPEVSKQDSLEDASDAKRMCYRHSESTDSMISSPDSEYELDPLIIDASNYFDEMLTEEEFNKIFTRTNRRVALRGFPEKTNRDDIMCLLARNDLEFDTVHMDKNGASCKVLFKNEEEARKCKLLASELGKDLNWDLVWRNTESDFMICVSHLPLHWTEEELNKLVFPFGGTEKCFMVKSKFLDGQSMGYAFLEFTCKSSAIRIRNELHNSPVEGAIHRIQVHWVDRVHDVFKSYENVYSKVLFISLPTCDNFKLWDLIGKIRNHERPIYIARVNIEDPKNKYLISEYNTSEKAARAHRFIQDSDDFNQVSFCVPHYSAIVIQKSFETVHDKFNDFTKNDGTFSLLKTPCRRSVPRETLVPRSEQTTMASAPVSCSTPVVIQNGFYHANIINSNNQFSSQKGGFSSRTQTYYAYQTVCPNANLITPATNTQSCQPTFSSEHRSNYQTAQFQTVNAHFIQAANIPGSTTDSSPYGQPSFVTASAPQFKPAHNYSRNSAVQNMPISYQHAVSYAQRSQYQTKDRSLCQDLFNVGTTDPVTNHRLAQERSRKMEEEKANRMKERCRMQQAFRRAEQQIYAKKASMQLNRPFSNPFESNSAPSYYDFHQLETASCVSFAAESVQDSPKSSNYLGDKLMKSLDLVSPEKNPLSFPANSTASIQYDQPFNSGSPAVLAGFSGTQVL